MTPEFSRTYRIDTLGEGAREVAIEADEAERAKLAARFGLISVDRLAAKASIGTKNGVIVAEGTIDAVVVQACVASGTPMPATVREPFVLKFVAATGPGTADDEIELTEADCDVVEYEGSAIDLGEAVAETMVLALDPFPRSPDADEVLKAAGVLGEGETGPFAALKALKDKLG
ncbi:YceD family protein [Sphingomonas montanisoli]|uniref:DUF177 domain-containing protein n=1 Tax=Sphingomonas montanisoli TaxID=2606412 RepID=A0A5D9C4D6_9SPHN|nr:DUF177 domain-containing protein [Sphingomonas montanisoli]TZG26072.1 DUF177 domain-containing protein [Sphingomonas montanisoli]